MTRSVDASNDRYLDALRLINQRVAKAQREVSTGKRVAAPSDDPDSIGALLQVRAELGRIEQTLTNMTRTKTEVDASESALQSAVKLFDRVRSLGMTAASGNNTTLTRQGIADELRTIIERFTGLANTEADGRFVFSGDSDQNHAYAVDFDTQTPPWGVYLGTATTRKATHPTGVQFNVAMTARDIFENVDPAKNAMQSIETLRQALLANDDQAIQSALAPLSGISAHLNSALMFYGNVQSQVADGISTGQTLRLRLSAERAELEDADATASILDLQLASFQQQIALQVKASAPRSSLFEYLK
jgi:flagellar hook-associated protein 3 FlgL